MAVTTYARTQTRVGGSNTNANITLSATPTSGDTIIVIVSRRNGGAIGAQTHATATGWTEVGHLDPTQTLSTFGTVLKKVSDGTESGAINFDWTSTDIEDHQILAGWVWAGGDSSSVTVSFLENTGTSHTWSADSLDDTKHFWSVKDNTDTSSSYPTGDTNITHTAGPVFHNGGFADSGGNTASQTLASGINGFSARISISAATTTTAIVDVADIAEAEVVDPARDYSTTGVNVDVTGPNNVDQVEGELTRDSDGFYWNHGTGWQAGADTTVEAFTSAATPLTHNYLSLPAETDMTEGAGYALRVRARDAVAVSFGAWSTRNFAVGTYEYATDITVTALAANAAPSGAITSHSDGQRVANTNTAGLTIAGTSADSDGTVTGVTVSVDSGTPQAASDTGTTFSTWSYTTGELSTGTHTVDVAITDNDSTVTNLTQISVVINALPTVVVTSHTNGQNLATTETTIPLAGTASDDTGGFTVAVRWQINGIGYNAYQMATGTSSWTYTITGLVAEDIVDIDARTTDSDGDVTVQSLTVSILAAGDTTDPTVAITSHADGQVLAYGTTSFVLAGTASDDVALTSVDVNPDTASGPTTFAATGTTDWTYTVTGLSNGESRQITVTSTDTSSNVSTAVVINVSIAVSAPGTTVFTIEAAETGNLPGASTSPSFYRFLYGDVTTGDILGELPLVGGASYSHVLNGSGTISASLPLETLPSKISALTMLPGRTTMWVEVDGVIVKGGILQTVSADRGSSTLELAATGFLDYLRRRFILSTYTYPSVEQLDIARGLVALAGTEIGLLATTATSGVTRDRTYNWWDHKNAGEAVEQLAAVEDGFDFRFNYSIVNNKPTATFAPIYPATGQATAHVFEHGRRNVEIVAFTSDSTALANTAIAVGAGNDNKTPRAFGYSTSAGYPPYQTVDSYSSVTKVSTLAEHAGRNIKRYEQPIDRAAATVFRGAAGPVTFGYRIGDQVRVKSDDGFFVIDKTMRIVGINVTYQGGAEITALDLAPLTVFT